LDQRYFNIKTCSIKCIYVQICEVNTIPVKHPPPSSILKHKVVEILKKLTEDTKAYITKCLLVMTPWPVIDFKERDQYLQMKNLVIIH